MPLRHNQSFLQPLERPALLWLAQRMPKWVTPDILTGFGFLGIVIAAAGYALSDWHHGLLWLVVVGLIVNWFGDSLDGTLARVRKIERPRYGFYLDQSLDAVGQMLVAIGVGISGLMHFQIAMFTLATYFLMSILSLIRALVSNEFILHYGKIGLTELRIIFIALIPVLYFFPPKPLSFTGFRLSYYELLTLAWAAATIFTFLYNLTIFSHRLAREEAIVPSADQTAQPAQVLN